MATMADLSVLWEKEKFKGKIKKKKNCDLEIESQFKAWI